jgi:hypothetical protein
MFHGYFVNTGETIDGYIPEGFGVGEADSGYVEIDYCLDCGQIQGEFPVAGEIVEKRENKMTPKRVLEIYEDMLESYKQYVNEGNKVDFPYEKLPGVIHVHLPPIHGRAEDKEKFKGVFEPDNVFEGTVIATVDSSEWGFPVHVLDIATEGSIRVMVAEMLFSSGNEAYAFLESQGF